MGNTALLKEIRKNKWLFGLLVGSGLAGGLAAIFQAYYLADIVNGAFLGGMGLSGLSSWLTVLLLAISVRAFFIWAQERVGFLLAARIKTDLRQRLLARLFMAGPVYVDQERSGELINTLTAGMESLDAYFAKYLPQLASALLLPVAILAVVFSLDITAGLIMLVTAPLIPLFMMLIGGWAASIQRRQWTVLSRLSGHFFDVLKGLTTLKIFGRSAEQVEVISRLSEQFRETTLGVLKVAFLSALALELLTTLSTALVAVVVGLKLLFGKLYFHQAFFVLLLAPEYYLPLRLLGSRFHAGLASSSAAERIYGILNDVERPPKQQGQELSDSSGLITVSFDQVTFSYAERPALRSVSFSVGPGECLALVGPSGAGKSTITDLLLGFIEPSGGSISVNGQALTGLNRQEWLKHVAYVPQFPYLFPGTVADNISFGMAGTQAAVEIAARDAGAHEFISLLPQGYATLIGEGSRSLSGGEVQRIAIARAFFKNAPLLILDEATTGLDPQNEATVREAFFRLMADKTVVVIAHRLSTACRADRILVLEQGMVAQIGSHQELIVKQGLYSRLATAYRGAT